MPRQVDEERLFHVAKRFFHVASDLIFPCEGCVVICQGLVGAPHLKNRIGEVRSLLKTGTGN